MALHVSSWLASKFKEDPLLEQHNTCPSPEAMKTANITYNRSLYIPIIRKECGKVERLNAGEPGRGAGHGKNTLYRMAHSQSLQEGAKLHRHTHKRDF
jgi:hypothetical protein